MTEHSEDYKRGLLDMLDVLTNTTLDPKPRIVSRWRENTDINDVFGDTGPFAIALKYREELESRKAIQAAVNLLEENGYFVGLAGLITELEAAADYLRRNGWTAEKPGSPAMSTDQMIDALWESGYCVSPRAPGMARQQPPAKPQQRPAMVDDPAPIGRTCQRQTIMDDDRN